MEYTEDQILDLFEKSSQDVQDTLSSQELLDLLTELRKTHGLHVDAVGKIAELIRNLLLGITSPTDYYNQLLAAGLSSAVAQAVVTSTNEQIFIPLRNRMQGKTQSSKQAAVAQPAPALGPAAEPKATVAITQPATPLHQTPQPPHIEPAPHTQVFTSTGGWPGAPTGNWQPAAAVHVYVPSPAPAQPQTAPVTVVPHPVAEPRPAQPTAPIAQAAAPTQPRPVPTPPQNLPGAPTPDSSIEKSYVADPYREPPV